MQKTSVPRRSDVERVRAAIVKAGFDPGTIGRPRLMKLIECSDHQARLYIEALQRGEKPKPKVLKIKETLTVVEEHRLKRENHELRSKLNEALAEREQLVASSGFTSKLFKERQDIPTWVHSPKKHSKRIAMPVAVFSDAHFDERVYPEQVNFVNGYDRRIAEGRLKCFFDNTIELAKQYLQGVSYPGIVVPFAGDVFSGDIHEELQQTNEDVLLSSVIYWVRPVAAGLTMLADEFGHVFVPGVVGNHPRTTKKPRAKFRVRTNFDWLFLKMLEWQLEKDARIAFQIPESPECHFKVLNTRFLMTHGDSFRGGSGIAGLLSPMMIGDARIRKRTQATRQDYDWLIIGHWHQFNIFKNIVMNGSLKGFDEWAQVSNYEFEKPRQAFFLVDPDRGVTITSPIHVMPKERDW